MTGRPNTDLTIITRDASGTEAKLGSNARDPRLRPRNIQWATKLGAGFDTGGYNLARRVDADNPDQQTLNHVEITGADGDTGYEGFISDSRRSFSEESHTLDVTVVGYMASAGAAGEGFTAVFVDRDLSRWGEMSTAHRAALVAGGYNPGGSLTVAPDSAGQPGLVSARDAPLNKPVNRYVYDAGERNRIGRLHVGSQALETLTTGDTNLNLSVFLWSDDNGADQVYVGENRALTTLSIDLAATPRRFAVMDWQHQSTNAYTAGSSCAVRWQNVAVYGDHGLPLIGDTQPYGVAASDVIKWLAACYVPLLNTAGVQQTRFAIPHLVFRETTRPYDAWLAVNAFHLWQLAVWENRTLHYGPVDLTDWDWQIRHDEAGNTMGLQGDSVEQLRNGIIVQFPNVATGAVETLHPDDHPDLRDTSIDNIANQHGWRLFGEPFVIPFPTTAAAALQLGRARLNEDAQQKAPGQFTAHNHIRDRAGNWQPVWKVRAGHRIRLTSSAALSARPRLIRETSYSHDARTVTIAVDGPLRRLEAVFDRILTALTANGLT